jgi:hypothetical protein
VLEVADSPHDLGVLVAAVGQRHDHVVVNLGDGGAVSGKALLALAVGFENGPIGFGGAVGHPREQSGANVEADAGVVVDDADDAIVGGENAGGGVGRITLGGDALVPVVIGISRVLLLDQLKPGVLTRRLIKMTVNTEISVHITLARFMKE